MKSLYNSYREIANANVVSDTDLLDKVVALEEENKKQTKRGDRLELLYSQTTGRKNTYKNRVNEV